jgi:hypothetical protein
VIIKLTSGKKITHGPCRWPWQILELWGAMIETSDLAGKRPNGSRCAADVHSETNATGTKRMLVCAELSAGRVVDSRPQAGGVCRVKP